LQSTGLNKSTAVGGTFTNITSILGNSATTDTLIGPNATTTWTISGTNARIVSGLTFSGFENLTGGSAADTFAFTGAGSIRGSVNGGGGVNILDVSGYSSPATINLQTKKATPITGTFSNFTSFVGDNATSTLVGSAPKGISARLLHDRRNKPLLSPAFRARDATTARLNEPGMGKRGCEREGNRPNGLESSDTSAASDALGLHPTTPGDRFF
jgi:hypothetical protein